MRFLFLLAILLAFPVAEIWLLVKLGQHYGGWLLVYLVLVAILGWRLLMDEKFLILGRLVQTLSQGGTPARALFASAKNYDCRRLADFPRRAQRCARRHFATDAISAADNWFASCRRSCKASQSG